MAVGCSRKVLYLDNMLGGAASIVDQLRCELGDLSQVKLPADKIIFDILHAVGIPDDGICIIMGNTLYEYVAEGHSEGEPLSCEYCDQQAVMVLNTPVGPRIACSDHAYELIMASAQHVKPRELVGIAHA